MRRIFSSGIYLSCCTCQYKTYPNYPMLFNTVEVFPKSMHQIHGSISLVWVGLVCAQKGLVHWFMCAYINCFVVGNAYSAVCNDNELWLHCTIVEMEWVKWYV